MSKESEQQKKEIKKHPEEDLPVPWQRIQAGIWLLGLGIIAWLDWWWPGILFLAALSGLAQGAIQLYVSRRKEIQEIDQVRATWLPSVCPNCGGPLSVSTVKWTGLETADCPYCKANLKRPV